MQAKQGHMQQSGTRVVIFMTEMNIRTIHFITYI
jgi:hypothetical protein